jgi:hypothetical protein
MSETPRHSYLQKGVPLSRMRVPFLAPNGFQKSEHIITDTYSANSLHHDVRAFWRLSMSTAIEIVERHATLTAIALKDAGTSIVDKAHSLAHLAVRSAFLERGERIANGLHLRQFDEARNKKYGAHLHSLREDIKRHDHASPHDRRNKAFQRMITFLFPRLSLQNRELFTALGMFPKNHDAYQLEAAHWNAHHATPETKLASKALHQEFGAVMLGAQDDEFMLEANVNMKKQKEVSTARDAVNLSKLMILSHDRGHKFIDMAHGTVKAFEQKDTKIVPISDEAFVRAADDGVLDWFTISDAQLMMYIQKKLPSKSFPSQFGLSPEFEAAKADKLAAMSRDTTPYFTQVTDAFREDFVNVLSIAILADHFDMIYPPSFALLRKLNVEVAAKREFFVKKSIEEFIRGVFDTDGESLSSDFERTMWEFASVANVVKRVGIDKNSSLFQMIKESMVLGILESRRSFKRLMNGEDAVAFIKDQYIARARRLGIKALNKTGASADALHQALEDSKDAKTLGDVRHFFLGAFIHNGAVKYKNRFLKKLHDFSIDIDQTIERVGKKPGNPRVGEMKQYLSEDFDALNDMTKIMLQKMETLFEMNEGELNDLVQRFKNGERAYFPGVGSYDRLGTPADARVWTKSTKKYKHIAVDIVGGD